MSDKKTPKNSAPKRPKLSPAQFMKAHFHKSPKANAKLK